MTALKTVLLIALVWTVVSLRTENLDGVLVPEDARPDVASASSIIAAPSSSNHEDPYVAHFLKDDDDDLLDNDEEEEEEQAEEEEEENESEDEASEWERGTTHTVEEEEEEEGKSETGEEEDAETVEAVEAVQEAARDPPELSDAAAEAHRAVLGSACKTLSDGMDTLRLKGEWCLLRLYVLHLVADRYPGSLSASLAKLGVVTLEDTSPETFEDLDKQLNALMMPTVAAQLNEFMEQHPKSRGWVKTALAKMPRLSDIFELGIKVAVLTMGFNAAMQVTTAEMMRWHRVRLRILEDAGLERSCRDEWAIARHLLALSAPFKNEPGQVIRRMHARKMLFCYVSEDGKSTLRGCEPVPTTSPVVQRALDIATELEMSDPARVAARSAAKAASSDMLDRAISTAKKHMKKLEPASPAAKREEQAIRKQLLNVLKEAIMGRRLTAKRNTNNTI